MSTKKNPSTESSIPEGMIKTPEGDLVPIPTRSKRGRKSRRKGTHPLKDIRLSRDMTLEELAEASGLSPSYLSRLESGSRRLNVDTINRLSEALKCDPGTLISSTDKWASTASDIGYNIQPGGILPGRLGQQSQNQSYMAGIANQQIPLYETDIKTGCVDFSNPSCHIPAPTEIANVPGAFAYTVHNHTMEPRFYRGDRLLVHPGKPLSPRATALVITTDNRAITGEFIAWRHQSELDMPEVANDQGPSNPEDYVLELKQYRNEDVENQGRRATDGPIGQVLIMHNEISSISRVIGMVEA